MSDQKLTATIRRASPYTSAIDLQGQLSGFGESPLTQAYATAVQEKVHNLLLNFTNVEYISSTGIGTLVTLVIRAQRENKKLAAYGVSDHYKKIFELTRIDQVIPIYETEAIALATIDRMDLPEREY
jgi:anti-sigma B factor antagonist